jgi:hypothetical protein
VTGEDFVFACGSEDTGVTDAELLAQEAERLLPGAGALDLAWPDALAPRLRDALDRALAARRAGREPDPEADAALRLVVVDAYYAHPEVRAALGYPGPRAIPLPPRSDAELEPLLDRVRARGPVWRGSRRDEGDRPPP